MRLWIKLKWHQYWMGRHFDISVELGEKEYLQASKYHWQMCNYHYDKYIFLEMERVKR